MKIKKLNELNEFNTIFSQEFYDLMQEYRHTPMRDQKMTIETFQNVLDFVEKNYILKDETVIKQWLLEQEAKKYNI
jgi:plasmid replication initiation protein